MIKIYNRLIKEFPDCKYDMQNNTKNIFYKVNCDDFAFSLYYVLDGQSTGDLIIRNSKLLEKKGTVNEIIKWAKETINKNREKYGK